MSTFRGKQVLIIDTYTWVHIDNAWYVGDILIDPQYNKQLKNISNNLIKEIPDESCLYFGKTSKFPRFKLKDLNFKRCIKVEKSDYQVIGNLEYHYIKNVHVFYKDDIYYIISNMETTNFYKVSPDKQYSQYKKYEKLSLSLTEKIEYLKKHLNTDVMEFYPVIYYTSNTIWADLERILSGEFKKCIKDDDLDTQINKKMEDLTIEDIDLLDDMLNSSDVGSLELGLKMLIGYNVSEYPCTVRLLLYNSKLSETKAWNSVGVKRVRASCGWKQSGWNWGYAKWALFDDKEPSDKDLKLVQHLWKKKIIEAGDKWLSQYNIPGLTFKSYAE